MNTQSELTDDEKQILSDFAGVQRTLDANLPLSDESKTSALIQRARMILDEKGEIAKAYVQQIGGEQATRIFELLKQKESNK